RMRRLDARFNDRRNSVSRSNRLGKTENCAGRRICRAESSTSTEAAKLVASNRSSANAGNGTSMTKTRLTAAIGTIHSTNWLRVRGPGATAVVGISGVLLWRQKRRERGLPHGIRRPEFRQSPHKVAQECFVPPRRYGREREPAADSRPWECSPSGRFP